MLLRAALAPTGAELAVLSPLERVAFSLGDLLTRLPPAAQRANDLWMSGVIRVCGGRRIVVHGLTNVASIAPSESILLVANHRSFFDFYITSAVLYWRAGFRRRTLFPVRGRFFYDHPLGPLVNLAMSGMRMFPPIFRDRERGARGKGGVDATSKAAFNRYSLARCVAELEVPGTVMGLHPEGTRNKSDDPYSLLPAQPGVGKVALEAKRARVVPVFVVGMSNSMQEEFVRNWTAPADHPIRVYFGAEVDLCDLRATKSRAAVQLRAANRCREAILALAALDRGEGGADVNARAQLGYDVP